VSKSVQTLDTFPPPNSNNANNINESSNTLSTFCEQNAHKFILINIPIHLLEAMYERASAIPLKKFEVISYPLKQLCLYKSFDRLFPLYKNLWDELFGVLKKSFFKHHPYIYSKEINATILVTDGPMECTQQPHMDYCWEMILCTSQQEACSNRTQLLRGNNNIPLTGHLPLFSLMVLTFTCGLVQVLESLST
jgi:hypothetical protein